MARAFREEQNITGAQGVRSNTRPTGNISLGTFNFGSLKGFADALSNLSEDKDRKSLGRWLAKQREKISALPNPVDQTRAVESAIKVGTARFGAVTINTIEKFLKEAPRSKVTFSAGSGRGQVVTGLGQKQEFDFNVGPNAAQETNKVILTGMAKFQANFPRTSAVWDNIFKRVIETRKKNAMGEFGASSTATFAIQAAQLLTFAGSSLDKAVVGINSLRNTPGFASLGEQGGEYAIQAIEKSVSEFSVGMSQFLSGTLMNMLTAGRINGVAPKQLVEGVQTYMTEYIVKLQEAANKMGVPQAAIMKIVNEIQKLRPNFQTLYDAQFNRQLETARIQNEHIKILLGNSMNLSALRIDREVKEQTGQSLFDHLNRNKAMTAVLEVAGLYQKAENLSSGTGPGAAAALQAMRMAESWNSTEVWRKESVKAMSTDVNKWSPQLAKNFNRSIINMINAPNRAMYEEELEKALGFITDNKALLIKRGLLTKEEAGGLQRQIKVFLGIVDDRTKAAGKTKAERKAAIEKARKALSGWKQLNKVGGALNRSLGITK